MVASGGILGWHDIRQNPDTFQALGACEDAEILHSFSSSYAKRFGDYTCIRGKDARLYSQGGEGSPRWFLILEVPRDDRLFYGGFEEAIKKGEAELVTIEGNDNQPPIGQSDDSKPHLDNWIDRIRDRNLMPNGHIHTGFWHSVGAAMATQAYREGKKLYWDRKSEQIVDNPVLL